jgi:hypothetical protein
MYQELKVGLMGGVSNGYKLLINSHFSIGWDSIIFVISITSGKSLCWHTIIMASTIIRNFYWWFLCAIRSLVIAGNLVREFI